MDMDNVILIVLMITLFSFVLNLPFGYMRSKSKKFSISWILYIHLPVPFVFLARNWAELSYMVIPILLAGAVAGQLIGGRMNPQKAS